MPSPTNDALLLIAHGSPRYPDAARTILAHAQALRAQKHFAVVAVGLLNGIPSVADALAACGSRPIHVVPFFMEDGYFSTVAVPRALAGVEAHLYPAIGTHQAIPSLIAARVQRLGVDPASRPLVLVGHGSAKSPKRVLALHGHAERMGALVALLEEAPFVADVLAETPDALVLGMFAGEGAHVREDLAAAINAAPGAVDLGSIGDEPGWTALILDWVAKPARTASLRY